MYENYKLHTITWSHFALAAFFIFFYSALIHLVLHELVAQLFVDCCCRRRRFNGSINKVKWWSYHRYSKLKCEKKKKKKCAVEWVNLWSQRDAKQQDKVSGRVWWMGFGMILRTLHCNLVAKVVIWSRIADASQHKSYTWFVIHHDVKHLAFFARSRSLSLALSRHFDGWILMVSHTQD